MLTEAGTETNFVSKMLQSLVDRCIFSTRLRKTSMRRSSETSTQSSTLCCQLQTDTHSQLTAFLHSQTITSVQVLCECGKKLIV